MSKVEKFTADEWDEDETGDQLHEELFQKNKRPAKKGKRRQKSGQKTDAFKPAPKAVLSTNIACNLKKIMRLGGSEAESEEKPKSKPQKVLKKSGKMVKSKSSPKIKKKLKRLEKTEAVEPKPSSAKKTVSGLNIANLKKQLAASLESGRVAELNSVSLREKMMDKLNSARFRYLNEQMYTKDGKEALKMFQDDPESFKAYHEGYRQQVEKWPLNPLDLIITSIKKMSPDFIIADFGCGDAQLSESVSQTVHSFDFVAVNDRVVACDMARVPLKNGSVDVAVFCLSLMGTNLKDYLLEANRVLKIGGTLKIAEVESRFDGVEGFVQALQKFGFKNTMEDLSHDMFYLFDFEKERDIKNKSKLPTLTLNACLYKKR